MTDWFARPVLHVKDVEAALGFYMNRLGFTSPWRYSEASAAPPSKMIAKIVVFSC